MVDGPVANRMYALCLLAALSLRQCVNGANGSTNSLARGLVPQTPATPLTKPNEAGLYSVVRSREGKCARSNDARRKRPGNYEQPVLIRSMTTCIEEIAERGRRLAYAIGSDIKAAGIAGDCDPLSSYSFLGPMLYAASMAGSKWLA